MSRLIKALQGAQQSTQAVDCEEPELLDIPNEVLSEEGALVLDIDQDVFEQEDPSQQVVSSENYSDTESKVEADTEPEPRQSVHDYIAVKDEDDESKIYEETESLYKDISDHESNRSTLSESDYIETSEPGFVSDTSKSSKPEEKNIVSEAPESASNDQSIAFSTPPENIDLNEHQLEEGVHSEEFVDTSESIAVKFAEVQHKKRSKGKAFYAAIALPVVLLCIGLIVVGYVWISADNSMPIVRKSAEVQDSDVQSYSDGEVVAPDSGVLAEEGESAISKSEIDIVGHSEIELEKLAIISAQSKKDKPVVKTEADVEVNISGVQFLRTRKAAHDVDLTVTAYQHYIEGELDLAASVYDQAIQRDAFNIDANLGMGAVQLELQNFSSALRYFERVLSIDAFNVYALDKTIEITTLLLANQDKAGVVTDRQLPSSKDYVSGEARDYFQLGQIYAGKSKWAEAQQAFFQAHSMDRQSDIYAYHLAIALDNMQKSELAVGYYETILARRNAVSLDYQQVESRVAAIKNRLN